MQIPKTTMIQQSQTLTSISAIQRPISSIQALRGNSVSTSVPISKIQRIENVPFHSIPPEKVKTSI